jgi:hypothetical protein
MKRHEPNRKEPDMKTQTTTRETILRLEAMIRRGDATVAHLERYEKLTAARRPAVVDAVDADWDAFDRAVRARLAR